MRSTRRGPSSRAWDRMRRETLDRDGWLCRTCGKRGRMEVHHVDGDSSNNDPSNRISLCRGCHIRIHRRRPRPRPGVAAWDRLVKKLL